MTKQYSIIADGRWSGKHGIGRFSTEILARLQHTTIFNDGPAPLSIQNVFWQFNRLNDYKNQYRVF